MEKIIVPRVRAYSGSYSSGDLGGDLYHIFNIKFKKFSGETNMGSGINLSSLGIFEDFSPKMLYDSYLGVLGNENYYGVVMARTLNPIFSPQTDVRLQKQELEVKYSCGIVILGDSLFVELQSEVLEDEFRRLGEQLERQPSLEDKMWNISGPVKTTLELFSGSTSKDEFKARVSRIELSLFLKIDH